MSPTDRLLSPELAPWQRSGAAELARLLDAHGWALLADSPGLGKTRTACAAAALGLVSPTRPLVVIAPPRTLAAWEDELDRWGMDGVAKCLLSSGLLRRRAPVLPAGALVVVDEAHAFRNPETRGYRRLALALRSAYATLFVSATPIHNSVDDATALLGLAPYRTWRTQAPDGDVAAEALFRRLMVRRTVAELRMHWPESLDSFGGPSVPVKRLDAPVELDRTLVSELGILAERLSPVLHVSAAPLRAVLLQRLASSPAALRATLARLSRYLGRMVSAVNRGEALTPALWRRLFGAEQWGASEVQEWLPFGLEVLQPGDGRSAQPGRGEVQVPLGELMGVRDAVDQTVARTPDSAGPTGEDLEAVFRRRRQGEGHPPLLIFTEYTDTARALWRDAPSGLRLAFLTASEGALPGQRRVARANAALALAALPGGASRVPPPAQRTRPPLNVAQLPLLGGRGPQAAVDGSAAQDRWDAAGIDGFVLTPCWSEGINLPGVETVIHWDLPWTPARLQQRLGRVQRPGGARHILEVRRRPIDPAGGEVDKTPLLAAKADTADRVLTVVPAPEAPAFHVKHGPLSNEWQLAGEVGGGWWGTAVGRITGGGRKEAGREVVQPAPGSVGTVDAERAVWRGLTAYLGEAMAGELHREVRFVLEVRELWRCSAVARERFWRVAIARRWAARWGSGGAVPPLAGVLWLRLALGRCGLG